MAEQLTYIVIGFHSRDQYDTRQYLTDCMDSLMKNTTNYRMIFVDDFCDDAGSEHLKTIASKFPETYIIRTFKQRWFTRSFNLGLRLVRSPWAVLLNSDTIMDPGWLEELYAVRDAIQSDGSRVGLVGSVQSQEEPRRYGIKVHPGYVTGHCWLVSMQAMYECSADRGMPGFYLDETQQKTIHIFSDNEICERMNKLGYITAEAYKSNVGHHGGKSWGHNLGRAFGVSLNEVNDY